MKVLAFVSVLVVINLCPIIGFGSDPGSVRVIVGEKTVGRITLGNGWNTWDHWWGRVPGRYRLEWNDEQWDAYLGLLKESGADWLRVDFYYGDTEPRNDNSDPEVIDWSGFTFDNPRLRSFYKLLDFCQANGIDVYLVYSYLRSNHEYNRDRKTGWLSKEAVSKGFLELWTRPKDEPVDRRELAENLAATAYYLIKKRGYTCIKQVSLYVEPNSQWTNVDGFRDTIFLGKLLTKLGIRNQIKILAPHVESWQVVSKPGDKDFPPPSDFDVYAVEDYHARVNWQIPKEGLQDFNPSYKTDVR